MQLEDFLGTLIVALVQVQRPVDFGDERFRTLKAITIALRKLLTL